MDWFNWKSFLFGIAVGLPVLPLLRVVFRAMFGWLLGR